MRNTAQSASPPAHSAGPSKVRNQEVAYRSIDLLF
jgi:hypothetical protein